MYAEAGGPIFSLKMNKYIELNEKNVEKIFLFVGDFRFGNSYLKLNDKFDDLFIDGYTHPDREAYSLQNDEIMYKHALKCMDYYVNKYGEKIQFVFWCLNFREVQNINKGKYLDDKRIYSHPTWNYYYLCNRYSKNIVDISVIRPEIEEYTLDNQGHPSMKGFSFLYHSFELKGTMHAKNKVNKEYINIMKKLFTK